MRNGTLTQTLLPAEIRPPNTSRAIEAEAEEGAEAATEDAAGGVEGRGAEAAAARSGKNDPRRSRSSPKRASSRKD